MFDNLFSPSPAVWTGLIGGLVSLPLLIHLINLMRHQKVEWAAMEFLLKSHRKNNNWIRLKQLLLLLARMGTLLLALFMLAQVGCNQDRIARLLGGATTHHYVLLDDSFSMGDQGSEGTAFDRARATLSLIAARARNRQNQKFTLIRYSKSHANLSSSGDDSNIVADLNGVVVDNLFPQLLEDTKSRLQVSTLAVNLLDALAAVKTLIGQRDSENAIVYILSDFRASDWANPTEAERQLAEIHQSGAAIEFINCVTSERPNLAITEIVPAGNVRVAGTPLMMRVTVKNCSDVVAEKVQLNISTQTYDAKVDSSQVGDWVVSPTINDLPTVFIESIAAGKSESREFPVFFNSPGQHAIHASLAKDALGVDNDHWNVTSFDTTARVLLIDDQDQYNASFVSLAINPGGMTGISPEIRSKDFLRDASLDQLNEFDVIYLLGVDRLDETSVKSLEQFAGGGGGVGFFLGDNTDLEFYTQQLYRSGEGLFPMPLEKAVAIDELVDDRIPDIKVVDNPIFPPGMQNALLDLVQIRKVLQPPLEWISNPPENVTVAATVRGDPTKPLVVQSRFGRGNVMLFTTTAGPIWNNWSRNGTFPPIMLLVENLLAAGRYVAETSLVGVPIRIAEPAKLYGPELTFVIPSESHWLDESLRVPTKLRMSLNPTADEYQIVLGQSDSAEPSSDVVVPGIYDIWLRRADAQLELKRLALNVDTSESEMKLVNPQNLLAALDKVKPSWVNWDAFSPEPKQQLASSISKLFLFLLLGLLIAEQTLAYSASYHKRTGKKREVVGGRWLRSVSSRK
jgi:hypothetical protein